MKEESYRRKLIRLVTFLAGIYFFLEFLFPEAILKKLGVSEIHSEISTGFIVVGSMAIGLGIINLFRVHGTKVIFRRKDWPFSFTLLAGLLTMMTLTALDWVTGLELTTRNAEFRALGQFAEAIVKDAEASRDGVPDKAFRIDKLFAVAAPLAQAAQDKTLALETSLYPSLDELDQTRFKELSTELEERVQYVTLFQRTELEGDQSLLAFGKYLTDTGVLYEKVLRIDYDHSNVKLAYLFLYEGLFVSLGAAMFSLLGVYIASAAYRAFRIKSVESLLMMSAAVIVMLGQIPFYEYIWLELPAVRQWLLEVPNTAAFRAIKIGAAIAGLVMAFRMWFSIESESFSPRGAKK